MKNEYKVCIYEYWQLYIYLPCLLCILIFSEVSDDLGWLWQSCMHCLWFSLFLLYAVSLECDEEKALIKIAYPKRDFIFITDDDEWVICVIWQLLPHATNLIIGPWQTVIRCLFLKILKGLNPKAAGKYILFFSHVHTHTYKLTTQNKKYHPHPSAQITMIGKEEG